MLEIRRKTAPPITLAKIGTRFFFDEVLLDFASEPGVDRGGEESKALWLEASFGTGGAAEAGGEPEGEDEDL